MNGIPVESAMIKKRYLHNWKDTFTCCEVLSIGNGSGVTGFLFSIFFRGKEREKETKDKFCIKKERERECEREEKRAGGHLCLPCGTPAPKESQEIAGLGGCGTQNP